MLDISKIDKAGETIKLYSLAFDFGRPIAVLDVVGVPRFELGTPCSKAGALTGLRYTPNILSVEMWRKITTNLSHLKIISYFFCLRACFTQEFSTFALAKKQFKTLCIELKRAANLDWPMSIAK